MIAVALLTHDEHDFRPRALANLIIEQPRCTAAIALRQLSISIHDEMVLTRCGAPEKGQASPRATFPRSHAMPRISHSRASAAFS